MPVHHSSALRSSKHHLECASFVLELELHHSCLLLRVSGSLVPALLAYLIHVAIRVLVLY